MAHDLTKTKGQARPAAEWHRKGGIERGGDSEGEALLVDSRQVVPEAMAARL